MAKIILLYVIALVMIFPLFWNHGNATTPRKLGVRQNAVTGLQNTNKVTFRGSAGQYSFVSSLPVHTNVETDPSILGSRHNAVTSLPNTKEATFDGPGHQYFTISSLSADHANAATPRILGARHNAVTGLTNINEATSGGSEHQDSHIPSSLAHHTNVIIPRGPLINPSEATSPKLGKRQINPIIITSLPPNTNEAVNSGESGLLSNYPISRSPTHETGVEAHPFHRFSPSQMWQPVQFEVIPLKLWASRHNGVTSLSNTNKAITSRGSGVQHSPISSSSAHTHATTPRILQTRFSAISTRLSNTNAAITSRGSGVNHSPISSSSAHTHATTPRTLGARHNAVTSSPNANEATTRKHGTRQNPIIVTSLPNTNEAANSGESGLNFYPISSSPTQINKVFPRDPDTGHVSSIIN